MRRGSYARKTSETDVSVEIGLDGDGSYEIDTGVGFFDHMLAQIARHGLFDLKVAATGDRHIDDHHTVEDVGIALGRAFLDAYGEGRGARRYGSAYLPMDDALSRVALDISRRPFLVWRVAFPTDKIGTFDTELVREFFNAVAMNGGLTLHVETLYGVNAHHISESCFKAFALALRAATEADPRRGDALATTKGAMG